MGRGRDTAGQVRSGQVRGTYRVWRVAVGSSRGQGAGDTADQVRSGQVRSGQVRSGEGYVPCVACSSGVQPWAGGGRHGRSGQVRSGQVRSGQGRGTYRVWRVAEGSSRGQGPGDGRSGQVRSGQVRSGEGYAPCVACSSGVQPWAGAGGRQGEAAPCRGTAAAAGTLIDNSATDRQTQIVRCLQQTHRHTDSQMSATDTQTDRQSDVCNRHTDTDSQMSAADSQTQTVRCLE